MTIGIIGAGDRPGLCAHMAKAGYEVIVSNQPRPESFAEVCTSSGHGQAGTDRKLRRRTWGGCRAVAAVARGAV